MLKNKTIKQQIIFAWLSTIVFSLIATIITYVIGLAIYFNSISKPANYYENQIPRIEQSLRNMGDEVFQQPDKLAQLIPQDGINYQLLDGNAKKILGTTDSKIITSKDELLEKINTFIYDNNKYFRTIPIFNKQQQLVGAILLTYKIEPSFIYPDSHLLASIFLILILLSPFIYITVFTIFFSNKISKQINTPINLLINAAKQVKQNNLDFSVAYTANNELGQLCSSYEDMRIALKDSLLEQWDLQRQQSNGFNALAHDLKTPLTVIQGYTEALIQRDSKNLQYLDTILRNCKKLISMLQQMLSNAEVEQYPVEKAVAVNIQELLNIKLAEYQYLATAKELIITGDFIAQTDKLAMVAPTSLERILDNIVNNSIEHSPVASTINIAGKQDNHSLELSISDAGTGFSPQDLQHATEKFYRGDAARGTITGHLGLGLYIANDLINKQNATIQLTNNPDGGALVKIIFLY